MQLFQPCSSPEQSKAIADLSSDRGDGWGMTFCALSSDLGDGGGVTFFALSSGLSVGSGMTGVTFCAQPMTTQASATSAIESRNCTLFFHPHLQPPSLAVATRLTPSATHVTTHRCSLCGGGVAPSNPYPTWTLRFEADVTSLEVKIDTSAENLDVFGKGGQPCSSPEQSKANRYGDGKGDVTGNKFGHVRLRTAFEDSSIHWPL